jgi:hypothetical protein
MRNAATNNRVFCTNRQGTIRIYGFRDGRIRVNVQNASPKPCAFDGYVTQRHLLKKAVF